jgi:uncharacterized small protein (DUF1192 family)
VLSPSPEQRVPSVNESVVLPQLKERMALLDQEIAVFRAEKEKIAKLNAQVRAKVIV